MQRIDAKRHLEGLEGRTIHTLTGRPNRVLRVKDGKVIADTGRSPAGAPVPIALVQDAIDRLIKDRHLEINVESVGYRSAFIGAVLLTIPGARGEMRPRRITLGSPSVAPNEEPAPRVFIHEFLGTAEGEELAEEVTELPPSVPLDSLVDWLEDRYGPVLQFARTEETNIPIGLVFAGPEKVQAEHSEALELLAVPYIVHPETGDEVELYEAVSRRRQELVANNTSFNVDVLAKIPLPDEMTTRRARAIADWDTFRHSLAETLAALDEDSFLIIIKRDSDRYVQFVQGGRKGFRVEAVGQNFLEGDDRLTEDEERSLDDLGWLPPDAEPTEARGNVNHYRIWPRPAPFAEVAELATLTLQSPYGVADVSELEYEAFNAHGTLELPLLGLPVHERRSAKGPELLDADPTLPELEALVGAALCDFLNQRSIERDDEGDIPIRFGSAMVFVRLMDDEPPWVHLFAPLLWGVRKTGDLLEALNDINAAISFGKVLWTGQQVIIADELTSLYLSRAAFVHHCQHLGAAADHFDALLQERFGGKTMFGDPLPAKPTSAPGYL